MLKLVELIGHELKWIQPHALKMEYELRSSEIVAATLRFQGGFNSTSIGTSADGSWIFRRVGFWQNEVVVRASETETDLAVFKHSTWDGRGTVGLPDGHKYSFTPNTWATQYEFRNEMAETFIIYRKIGGVLRRSSLTELDPLAKDVPEMPWIVLLGWYFIVLMYMD